MLREFFQQLHDIHPLVGELGEWALIGLLLTIAILLLSIPSHLIALALRGPVAAAAEFFARLSATVRMHGERLFNAATLQPEQYTSLARYRFVFDQNERQLRSELQRIGDAAREIPTAVNRRTVELEAGVKQLTAGIEALTNLEIEASNPEIPDLDRLQADGSAHRRGLGKFIIALALAPALITVNTIMLQKFLDGLVTIYVGDFRLSWILSLFFSLLELSLGVWLYYQQQKPRTGDARTVLAELFLYAAILGLAGVEFVFYAVLSGQIDTEVFRPLFAPAPVPSWFSWWLAPFGPIVVLILTFAGHSLIEGWDELRHGATARALRRQLAAIETAGGKLIAEFEVAKGHAKELTTQVKDFRRQFVGSKDQPPEMSEQVTQSAAKLAATADEILRQRREPYTPIDDGEAIRTFYVQLALSGIAAVVIGLFVYIQIAFLPRLGDLVIAFPAVIYVIAFVEAGVVVGASFLLAHSVRLVIGETDLKIVATPRDWIFGTAAVIAILAVLGFNIFLILRESTRDEWLWIALAVTCVSSMVYIGRTFSLLLAALWSGIKAAILVVAAGAAWLFAGLFGLFRVICLAINGVMAILSWPFQVLTWPFRRTPRLVGLPA